MPPESAQIAILFITLSTPACVIPTASRTNARIEPGTTVALLGGVQIVESSSSDDGDEGTEEPHPYIQVDTQYGHKFENDQGLAVQLKVPLAIPYASLDLYYQFLDTNQSAAGAGVEVSLMPGVYATFTRDLGHSLFVTSTLRLYFPPGRFSRKPVLNPQLAIGSLGRSEVEVTALMSFAHHLDNGYNFANDGLELTQDGADYRKNFLLTGVSVRW